MTVKGLVIVVVGPTASGKTDLAVQLAKHFNTEVISADARQFYKEMQIGTARPLENELEGVPHHFLGNISIHDSYGAGQFAAEARPVLDAILAKNGNAIIVGGSGLYIKALLQGLHELPEVSAELRNSINHDFQKNGLPWLQNQVLSRDSKAYYNLDFNNPARLTRALELLIASGKTLEEVYEVPKCSFAYHTVYLGNNWTREQLYDRINRRTDLMMAQGLLAEAEQLWPNHNLNALHTVGYTEIFQYLAGEISLETAVSQIAQHTRNYAKRQLTWFRNQSDTHWIQPNNMKEILHLIQAKKESSSGNVG